MKYQFVINDRKYSGVGYEIMIADKMKFFIENSSAIRAMFEEGREMAKQYGAENVYDFSLGNPNVPAPPSVKQAIYEIVDGEDPVMLHGYMSNSGYEDVRKTIASHINKMQGTSFTESNIIMTAGAAGGLNVVCKTLLNPGDEVIVFAPYFGEYRAYVGNYDGVIVEIPPHMPDFMPDVERFAEAITKRTRIVIVNTPNNPTGVIYSEEMINRLAAVMEQKQAQYGTSIYLVSDEPYRELAYDGATVPYLTKYYRNTIVGYSYSKSLSLPGERIGYLVIPAEVDDYDNIVAAANVANRILGFVNAPSLMQRVVARCVDAKADISFYDRNRQTLYEALTGYGYECIRPQGAFYLFVKSPLPDEAAFCSAAKQEHILVVPGSSFGCPGYVRIAYCVAHDTILRALQGFERLAKEYVR